MKYIENEKKVSFSVQTFGFTFQLFFSHEKKNFNSTLLNIFPHNHIHFLNIPSKTFVQYLCSCIKADQEVGISNPHFDYTVCKAMKNRWNPPPTHSPENSPPFSIHFRLDNFFICTVSMQWEHLCEQLCFFCSLISSPATRWSRPREKVMFIHFLFWLSDPRPVSAGTTSVLRWDGC